MFSFTPSSVKKSNEQLVQKHERMTQMKLKRLRSNEKVGCSSGIFPERESQVDDAVSENFLQQTEGDNETESLDVFPEVVNEQEDVATNEGDLMEDDITNGHQTTMEELTTNEEVPREELPNADSQSEIHQLRQKLEDCNQKLQLHMQEIKALQARPTITKEQLQENNDMVTYYTGLPNFETLMLVFELAEKVMLNSKEHGNRKLTNFDEFLLVMIKLRLNLQNKDLGYRFKVSKSSVSQISHKWLNILYYALQFLIRWPSREELKVTLPECFREKFSNTVVIIDCTEIFIERASNLLARSQTWSNYKSHNTFKYLIGVTPQGTISFVSKAWGGRVSDKAITQECGILNKLLPGDVVLADRGFTIFDLVQQYQAHVKLPAFTKGKNQLEAKDVTTSRELARVRIHVERLIGMVKQKFTILEGILPVAFIKNEGESDLTVSDKLMVICCALVNLCKPIVPKD